MAKDNTKNSQQAPEIDLDNLSSGERIMNSILDSLSKLAERMDRYDGIVKNTNAQLEKMNKQYDRVLDRTRNIFKSNIDIKGAQKELAADIFKSSQKQMRLDEIRIESEKLILEQIKLQEKAEKDLEDSLVKIYADKQRLVELEKEQKFEKEALVFTHERLIQLVHEELRLEHKLDNARPRAKKKLKDQLEEQKKLVQATRDTIGQYQDLLDALTKNKLEIQESLVAEEKKKAEAEEQITLARQNIEAEGEAKNSLVKKAEEALKMSKEEVELAAELLKIEQRVNREIGVSGMLSGKLAEKLGIGEEFQEQMVLSTRMVVESKIQEEKLIEQIKNATGEEKDLLEEKLRVQQQTTKDLEKQKSKQTGLGSVMKSSVKNVLGIKQGMTGGMAAVAGGMGAIALGIGAVGLAFKGAKMAGDAVGGAMKKTGGIIKGLSEDSSDFFTNLTAPVNELLEKIPLIGGLLSGLVTFWASILDLIIGVDHRAVSLGRQMGLSASAARAFNDSMSGASGAIYATGKALMETQAELTKLTGLNNIASKSTLVTNIELAKFAGVEAEARGKIYETYLASGKTTKQIASNILGQTAMLKKTTGIAFNYQAIIKEVTSLSGVLGLRFAKYPAELTKSLLVVKSLGFEIKDLEGMGENLLNFEQSLTDEYEAQLLSGKNMNLMKARQLFLNGHIAEFGQEIAKTMGTSAEFLEKDFIIRQSIAKSIGTTSDNMANILRQQEIFTAFGVKDQKGLIERVRLAQTNLELKKQMLQHLSKEEYANLVNLSTQEKLMESFNKIKEALASFLTRSNVIEKLEHYINMFSDPENIKGIVERAKQIMFEVVRVVTKITDAILGGIDQIAVMLNDAGFLSDEKMVQTHQFVSGLRTGLAEMSGAMMDNLAPKDREGKIIGTAPSQNLMKKRKEQEDEYLNEAASLGFGERAKLALSTFATGATMGMGSTMLMHATLGPLSPLSVAGAGVAGGIGNYLISYDKMYEQAKAEKIARMKEATLNTKDALRYPDGKIIQPDKLDYTFLTKNPSDLFAPSVAKTSSPQDNQKMIKEIVTEVMSGMSTRPIIVHSKLDLDGVPVAKNTVNTMKDNPIRGYDSTYGNGLLNT